MASQNRRCLDRAIADDPQSEAHRAKVIQHGSSAGVAKKLAGEVQPYLDGPIDLLRLGGTAEATSQFDVGIGEAAEFALHAVIEGGAYEFGERLAVHAQFSGYLVRDRLTQLRTSSQTRPACRRDRTGPPVSSARR